MSLRWGVEAGIVPPPRRSSRPSAPRWCVDHMRVSAGQRPSGSGSACSADPGSPPPSAGCLTLGPGTGEQPPAGVYRRRHMPAHVPHHRRGVRSALHDLDQGRLVLRPPATQQQARERADRRDGQSVDRNGPGRCAIEEGLPRARHEREHANSGVLAYPAPGVPPRSEDLSGDVIVSPRHEHVHVRRHPSPTVGGARERADERVWDPCARKKHRHFSRGSEDGPRDHVEWGLGRPRARHGALP